MQNNRCVSCGAIIPEGQQVCVNCQKGDRKMTDKELIQALRYENIADIEDMMGYMEDAADRLEALLAENERLKAEMPFPEPPSTVEKG